MVKNYSFNAELKNRFYASRVLNLARNSQGQRERREREITQIIEGAEKEIQLPLSFETYQLIGAFLY